MRRVRTICAGALSALVIGGAVVGCGEELPTEVGAGLLPGGLIRTIEVEIDPARFLVADTSFVGYITAAEVGYVVLADAFEGALSANALARFGPLVSVISAVDTAGVTRVDTVPRLQGGRVVLRVDTLQSTAPGPVQLRLYRLAEEWDWRTANWTMRVDSPDARLAWQQPGGTRGALIGEAQWTPGEDSVAFAMDTLALRAWDDSLQLRRGAVIVADRPGARLRGTAIGLRLDYRPSFNADTLVTTAQEAVARTFVYDAPLPAVGQALRVGGVPGWRSYLQLRERLDTLQVPCPDRPSCVMALSAANITRATLVLHQTASPPGFSPSDSIRILSARVLVSDRVPLLRSPLGEGVGIMPEAMLGGPPPPEGRTVEVPITMLVRQLARTPDAEEPPAQQLTSHIALLPFVEGRVFGFASFAPAPRLRLVLTVATEVQLR